MKKAISLIIAVAFIALLSAGGYLIYKKGFSDGYSEGIANFDYSPNRPVSMREDIIGNFYKKDYPLLDLYFNKGENCVIVDRCLVVDKEVIKIIDHPDEIEYSKDALSVITYPIGRGYTVDASLEVYKDGELVKQIPYYGIEITDKDFSSKFRKVSRKQAEKIVGCPLAPVCENWP